MISAVIVFFLLLNGENGNAQCTGKSHSFENLPNLYTEYENGTFESTIPENIYFPLWMGQVEHPPTLSRSNERAFNSSFSTKVTQINYNTWFIFSHNESGNIKYDFSKRYMAECYVFVPMGAAIGSSLALVVGNNNYGSPDDQSTFKEKFDFNNQASWQRIRAYFSGKPDLIAISTEGLVPEYYIDQLRIVEVPDELSETHSIKNLSAIGMNDGEITIQLSGGIPPYFYNFSNGRLQEPIPVSGNSINIKNLSPGFYEVAVGDGITGCICRDLYNCHYPFLIEFFIRNPNKCDNTFPSITQGQFKKDKLTGEIVFVKNGCNSTIPLGCIYYPNAMPNVVSASAATLSDEWSYDWAAENNKRAVKQNSNANNFEKGMFGKWRPKSSFAYNAPLSTKTANYESGTFDLQKFNWQSGNNSKNWLKTNTVEKYSPQGEPIQERNLLGISSTAKFGYKDALPYLTANNAEYSAVFFESFENTYTSSTGNELEDGFKPTSGTSFASGAHSGSISWRIPSGAAGTMNLALPSFPVKSYKDKGMLVKFWIKVTGMENLKNINNLVTINSTLLPAKLPCIKVAQNGSWVLMQKYVTDFGSLTDAQNYQPVINYSGTGDIYLDDIRVQPADAQMTAYVYDKRTLKLLTVFDDQHFGLYYQYNGEGKLVRKQIETVNGVKTVQETQYNTPKNIVPLQ